jgi:hypothetical protein
VSETKLKRGKKMKIHFEAPMIVDSEMIANIILVLADNGIEAVEDAKAPVIVVDKKHASKVAAIVTDIDDEICCFKGKPKADYSNVIDF